MNRRRFPVVLLVHGGAGGVRAGGPQLRTIGRVLEEGYARLENGAAALDVVESAIRALEDSGLFNAGRGGRLQLDGHLRLDASLMEGEGLRAGAVAGIEGIRNPVSAARRVLESSPHVLLAGEGAGRFARFHRLAGMGPHSSRQKRLHQKALRAGPDWMGKYRTLFGTGTVGAAALDRSGTLSAGASTGGIGLMLPGRVGDSPLIGAGVYADNRSAAVSMTGEGESIIRAGLAREIAFRMRLGAAPRAAATVSLREMRERIGGAAGGLFLGADGAFALVHTTAFMIGGYRSGRREKISDRFLRV
jgi:beta-aspartyl-peptidase (threonine type)